MDFLSVIYLGHSPNLPLICPRSELSYGLEPHGLFHLYPARALTVLTVPVGQGGCTRGGAEVGTGWVLYRVPTRTQPGRILGYIKNILRLIGSYGRLTEYSWNYTESGPWI